jgi:hypothetical protein
MLIGNTPADQRFHILGYVGPINGEEWEAAQTDTGSVCDRTMSSGVAASAGAGKDLRRQGRALVQVVSKASNASTARTAPW